MNRRRAQSFPTFWTLTIAWIAFQWAGVGLLVEWWLAFRRRWPEGAAGLPNALAALAFVALVGRVCWGRRRSAAFGVGGVERRGPEPARGVGRQPLWRRCSLPALILAATGALWLIRLPVERLHLLQYSALVVLCDCAIRYEATGSVRAAGGVPSRMVPWLALALATCVGVMEEWLQSLTPGRFAATGDVGLDVLGGVLGLWGLAIWRGRQDATS